MQKTVILECKLQQPYERFTSTAFPLHGDQSFLLFFEMVLGREQSGKVLKKFVSNSNFWRITLKTFTVLVLK